MANISYQIEEKEVEDGVRLELSIEGKTIATASASHTILHDLFTIMGKDRQTVIQDLTNSLIQLLESNLSKVSISDIKEDSNNHGKFFAVYTFQKEASISRGVVWYDLKKSETGPENLSVIVRNRMRHEVHKYLTSPGTAARDLIDLNE